MGILLIFLFVFVVFLGLKFFVRDEYLKEIFSFIENIFMVFMVLFLTFNFLFYKLPDSDSNNYIEKTILSQETEIVETTELIALNDTNLTSGSLFLGSGSVNNQSYYYFYKETENGLKLDKLNADTDNVYIKYDENNPRIETKEKHITYNHKLVEKPNFWTLNVFYYIDYHKFDIGEIVYESEGTETQKIIYVPEGSITNDFNINMQ